MMLPRSWHLVSLFCSLTLAVSLASAAVVEYDVTVLDKRPQSRQNFVQGLEFHNDFLYVSSGNYGKSRLLRYRFVDGKLERARQLDARVFAEGLTILDDTVYQLTWQNKAMLVYDVAGLRPRQRIPLRGEGWGLTNNGRELIYTDGSDQLHFISPETGQLRRSLAVTEAGRPVTQLNELEWVDGMVWANVWRTDRIVIIDPHTGEVHGSINLAGLLPASERRPDTDVLNGIARNPADGAIWVTGKRWPWLYRIEITPAAGSAHPGGNSR